jgi:hypothetical protein
MRGAFEVPTRADLRDELGALHSVEHYENGTRAARQYRLT